MRPAARTASCLAAAALGACTMSQEAPDAATADALAADAAVVGDPWSSCDTSLPCPATAVGKVRVCGAIYDVATTTRMADPTVVAVRLYDSLAFVADPNATPIATVYPDSCGRYDTGDLAPPFSGYLAVVVDDAGTREDTYRPTAIATAVNTMGGESYPGVDAFATTRATDQAWTASAGLTGATFAERGVYLAIFIDPTQPPLGPFEGAPVAGVSITEGGATSTDRGFCFADTDPLTRLMPVAPPPGVPAVTGPNGSCLWINGALTQFSGVGGEPSGCIWPSNLAATPAGVVFVQERVAECP